ncbi:MAG: hypothetical protein NXI24_22655 [bacterium]|nr:hypothetical protein [bacterium]
MRENAVNVALVDQAEDYRNRSAHAFKRSGSFRIVHESASVAGLCEAVQATSPDVFLFDPVRPHIESLSTLDDLRANPAAANQTVAVLTTHRDADFGSEAIGRSSSSAWDDHGLPEFQGVRGLTMMQLAIADMLAAGLKPKEIDSGPGPARNYCRRSSNYWTFACSHSQSRLCTQTVPQKSTTIP